MEHYLLEDFLVILAIGVSPAVYFQLMKLDFLNSKTKLIFGLLIPPLAGLGSVGIYSISFFLISSYFLLLIFKIPIILARIISK